MRTFKKLSIWLILLVLLVQMSVPALAAATELRIIGPAEVPAVGEEFTVRLELSGNPGFNTFDVTIPYDRTKLECTEVEAGPLIKKMLYVDNQYAVQAGGAIVAAAAVNTQNQDGVLVIFHFKVLSAGAIVPQRVTNVGIGDSDGNSLGLSVTCMSENGEMASTDTQSSDTTVPEEGSEEQEAKPDEVNPEETVPEETTPSVASFTDIANHWGKKEIVEAAELGLFKGYPDGRFDPDANVTRAQFLTVLYRMAGSPAATAKTPFTDIAAQIPEFQSAIAWGYEHGYVNGKSETTFDPSGNVTRQEAMKILFGYSGGTSGMESMFTAIYDESFTDSEQTASWAKAGMYWGVYNDIISGTSKTTLTPQGLATRAQLAKMLVNYNSRINQIGG